MMRDDFSGRAAVVPVLILVLLASLALTQAIGRFSETIGVDFYHFWGVGVAQRFSGQTLGAPYGNGARYEAVLKQYGETVKQPRLRAVQRFWTGPDFTASPLLYRAFSVVSDDYTLSLAVFRTLQILAFVGAGLLLGALHRFNPFHLASLVLVSLLVYQPLLSDLRVANLGALQLAVLAAALALAAALPRARSVAGRTGLAASLLVVLAALALCKPNILLACLALAVHIAVRHGARLFGLAALPALLATATLLIVPCLYFGSWTVWQEWYRFVYGSNPRMLVRSIESGNYSTPLVVSSWLGADVAIVCVVVLAVVVASLLPILRPPAGSRTALAAARSALRRLFDNPHAAAALGILLTTAASPLSWVHYYVLLLAPTFWLLNASTAGPAVPILAATSMTMSAGIVGLLLWGLGWPGAMPATIALSWAPLWAALLIKLGSPEAAGAAAVHGVHPRQSRTASSTPKTRVRRTDGRSS